jgi:hypothetical protein
VAGVLVLLAAVLGGGILFINRRTRKDADRARARRI